MARRVPRLKFASCLKAFRQCGNAGLWFVVLTAGGQAAEIPISGTYGTVAMCIIDAFTDVPSAEINYNVGGAPLARVMAGEFDTPSESCMFKEAANRSDSVLKQSWDVDADCTSDTGNVSRSLKITIYKDARTVVVTDQQGTLSVTLDQCSVPYAERLSRELKRMPSAPKK